MDRTQYTTLLEVLTQVPDYRKRKGRQHRWLTLLSLIAAALASAQHTPQAIARWVREHRADLFAALPPTVSRLPSDVHHPTCAGAAGCRRVGNTPWPPSTATRPVPRTHASPTRAVAGAGARWQSRPWGRT